MQALKISIYLAVFTLANLIVYWFGAPGLIITALILIPFDFVIRCLFHEQWTGWELIWKLGLLVVIAAIITYAINANTLHVAKGSVAGFMSAQIAAGIFYQLTIKQRYFIKVNGSDVLAIIADSIVFQLVAFSVLDYHVMLSQIAMKIAGGLFWYWVIFVKLKLQHKWVQ